MWGDVYSISCLKAYWPRNMALVMGDLTAMDTFKYRLRLNSNRCSWLRVVVTLQASASKLIHGIRTKNATYSEIVRKTVKSCG